MLRGLSTSRVCISLVRAETQESVGSSALRYYRVRLFLEKSLASWQFFSPFSRGTAAYGQQSTTPIICAQNCACMYARKYDPKSMGARMREARKVSGRSQAELNKECGFSKGRLSKLEAGETYDVGIADISTLCSTLEISLDWLVFGLGKMSTPPSSPSRRAARPPK